MIPNNLHAPKQENTGFTLVELAVVMTIVGLLIGGVLKGQALIEQARARATIAQMQGYKSAMVTFRDKYDQIPGDFSHATERLPGCVDIMLGGTCGNGDGNNIIDPLGDQGILPSVTTTSGSTTWPDYERAMFWKHLALADLITDVNPLADLGNPAWGITHPSSYFSGGVHSGDLSSPCILASVPSSCNPDLRLGTYLTFRNSMVGDITSLLPGKGAVSPKQGMMIDRKFDNGISHSGTIVFGGINPACGANLGNPTNPPDEQFTGKDCVLFYYLGN